LLTTIVGIAVGYKSTVLPRKLEDMQKFLDGKNLPLNPYFKGFKGKISAYNGLKKTWLIEGVVETNEKEKSVRVLELPPLMKYDSFIKKLSKFSESSVDFALTNDSSDNVDITLKLKSGCTWEEFKDKVEKMIKMIVSETLVFVKNNSVVEYADIGQYLTEFRVHRESVRLEKSLYDLNVYNEELDYFKSKVEYLKFMLAKKRTETEIDDFLGKFASRTKTRLDRILLKELSTQSLLKTEELVKEMTATIAKEQALVVSLTASYDKLKRETVIHSKSTVNSRSVDLTMEDALEIDGIEVFSGEEEPVEEEIAEDEG
jgi:hypothetical protein